MLLVTLRDLQFRRARVLVVIALVTLVLSLLYLMTGLADHLRNEPRLTVEGIGADTWIVAEGSSGPFTSASVLPIGLDDQIGGDASPFVVSRLTLQDDDNNAQDLMLLGHLPGRLGTPRLQDGRAVAGPGEMIADEATGYEIGDERVVDGVSLEVVGLSSDMSILAGVPFIFTDLSFAQDLAFSSTDLVTGYFTTQSISDLQTVTGTYAVAADSIVTDTRRPIKNAIASVNLVRTLLWIVAAVVVGAVVYLSALERQREFAIMKAVGATDGFLGRDLAVQAVLIAGVSAVLGGLVARIMQPAFPLPIGVPTVAYWQIPLFAALAGLVAAGAGIRRVLSTDPADAFGGAA